MEDVVVGLIEEGSDPFAVDWAIERARTLPAHLRLVTPLDPDASNPDGQKRFLAETAERVRQAAPASEVETQLADGTMLHQLLELSESADLIVIGSHPDPAIRDGHVPSLPVSLAARSRCPVVVVPDDIQPQEGPIVVGVESPDPSPAVDFAAREAVRTDRVLRLVHTWESWKTLDARAEQVAHGDVLKATVEWLRTGHPTVRLEAVLEEVTAHDGVIANSRDASLIVLGTHGLGRETGVVLGAIHLEVMIRGGVPLCVVPLES